MTHRFLNPADPPGPECRCGHSIEVHDDCPCVHGCENRPCGNARCECDDFNEPEPTDVASERYDAAEWRAGW